MATPAELEKMLRRRTQSARKANGQTQGHRNWHIHRDVNSRQIADFTRQLATTAAARLPLLKSLNIIKEQQKNQQFQEIIQHVIDDLQGGRSLRDGLSQYPKVFSLLYVNTVHVGEVSGTLPEILNELATYLEKMSDLKRKLLATSSYPAVIILVASSAVLFLLFGIMPSITEMFRDFNVSMPLPTRILLAVTEFLRANVFYLLGAIGLIGLGVSKFVNTAKGRRLFDKMKINIPLIGAIIRKILLARFARTLGTLLRSGVSLLDALNVTATSSENQIFREHVLHMRHLAEKGEQMEYALYNAKIFPPLIVQMISIGEETAELPEMLTQTAVFYEKEIDAALEALTSIIEPVIIVAIGVVIGGAIIAIYLQIFDMMNVIQ